MKRRLHPLHSRALLATLSLGAAIASSLFARPCHADEFDEKNQSVLSYSATQKPHYLRLALEEVGILGAGVAQYWSDKGANSRDWQFKYNWSSFKERLEGKAYEFDTNGFDTNFLFHPTSGTLYYLTARSNHLSALESLGVAFASSYIWEFFGEFQEKLSVNDIFVTPLAGMAWGETSMQLGAYFLRACPSTVNEVIGSTLAPFSAVHDAVDGARREHSDCEDSASVHRFRFSLTGGEAWSEGIAAHAQTSARLDTEVVHIPGFARPGVGWSTFDDGNVSRLGVNLTLAEPGSSSVTDFTLVTQTVLAGLHYRNNSFRGARLYRSEALFGFMIGAEYSRHRYDPGSKPDRTFLLDLPALSVRYYGASRDLGWELTLDAGGVFGGADSIAQPSALRRVPPLELTSVAQAEGYNHVAGFTIGPRMRFDLGAAELGLDFRGDRLLGWRILDRSGNVSSTPVSEFRRRSAFWLSLGSPQLTRLLLSVNWTQRSGSLSGIRTSLNELSLNAGIELAP